MSQETKSSKMEDSKTVSFRMDDDSRRVLNWRAKELKISRNDLARAYVLQILSEDHDRGMVVSKVTELTNRVEGLIADQASGIEALLAWAGKLKEEEARKWVDENFRSTP